MPHLAALAIRFQVDENNGPSMLNSGRNSYPTLVLFGQKRGTFLASGMQNVAHAFLKTLLSV
jgi:hypothetical protein